MKQFSSIEKLDTGILYILELAASLSVLLLAFGLIASMANVLTKGSVLTDNLIMQRIWAWTQCIAIDASVAGTIIRTFRFYTEGEHVKTWLYGLLSVLLLFTAAIVSNIEAVQQTLNVTLSSAYLHVFVPVEALIWIRSLAIVLLIVAHALRHVQIAKQPSVASSQQPPALAVTPELVETLRSLLTQTTVSEEADSPALLLPEGEQQANTAHTASKAGEDEQGTNNMQRVKQYMLMHPDAKVREVAEALSISVSTANKWMGREKPLREQGEQGGSVLPCFLRFPFVSPGSAGCKQGAICYAEACVDLVIDETLERRWGSQISKRGHYRDSALSSRERSVSSPGLRWIVMAVVVTLPWAKQRWALPFLCVLATTPEVSERLGKRHKTVGMWAYQMISLVRRWLPGSSIKLMGDTAYSILELGLQANAQQVTLITTGRLDAVLHEPPPERTQHTIGRPRVVGKRLPALEQILLDPETSWQKLTLDWYGEGERSLEICTGTALWYRYGSAPLPIRWVLTRDPLGKRPPKAIFSTDSAQPAEEIIKDFMKRWSLEVTFEESRAHLGIETQRQWSDRAIGRSTPLLFSLYSLVTFFGRALHPDGRIPVARVGLVSQALRHLL